MNGHSLNVAFLESILYYDCELLFEAIDANGQRYIAVHHSEYPAGCEYSVAPAAQSDLAAFKAGSIGLRRLLLSHPAGEWYHCAAGRGRRPHRIDQAAHSNRRGLRQLAGGGLFRQQRRLQHRPTAGSCAKPGIAEPFMTAAADQDEVAPPLAMALGEQGLSVWDDDFALGAGDSRPGYRAEPAVGRRHRAQCHRIHHRGNHRGNRRRRPRPKAAG